MTTDIHRQNARVGFPAGTYYNAKGRGQYAATVDVDEIVTEFGADMAIVDGETWALRDLVSGAADRHHGRQILHATAA